MRWRGQVEEAIRRSGVDGFVAALEHPRASRATFEMIWGNGSPQRWGALLDGLKPDAPDPMVRADSRRSGAGEAP